MNIVSGSIPAAPPKYKGHPALSDGFYILIDVCERRIRVRYGCGGESDTITAYIELREWTITDGENYGQETITRNSAGRYLA